MASIFVVDDDLMMLRVLPRFAKTCDLAIETVHVTAKLDLAGMTSTIIAQGPDAVILDYDWGTEQNGAELAEMLVRASYTRHLAICTGTSPYDVAMDLHTRLGKEWNLVTIIQKPLSTNRLQQFVTTGRYVDPE